MATTVETAHDKIVTLIDNELGSGAGSPVANVYSYHGVANLVLDGITVEPAANVPVEEDGAIYMNEIVDNHEVTFSIRVHTGYAGGVLDVDGTVTLMDDLVTALRTNLDLAGGYRIIGFGVQMYGAEFDESKSTGAELTITIHKVENYAN
jgi:hypothetical protein